MGRPPPDGPVFFLRNPMANNQNETLSQQREKLDALRGYL